MLTSKDAPLVSVIIVNFNGEGYLNNCLSSVLSISYPKFEVVLVDNGSTDQSIEAAKTAFGNDKRLKIVKSHQNMGFSAGNNLGFAHTKGQYIVFLNSDTTVDKQWLDFLVDAMEEIRQLGWLKAPYYQLTERKLGMPDGFGAIICCFYILLVVERQVISNLLLYLKYPLHLAAQ